MTPPSRPPASPLHRGLERPRMAKVPSRTTTVGIATYASDEGFDQTARNGPRPPHTTWNCGLFQTISMPSISETAWRRPPCMMLWASGPPSESSSYWRRMALSGVRYSRMGCPPCPRTFCASAAIRLRRVMVALYPFCPERIAESHFPVEIGVRCRNWENQSSTGVAQVFDDQLVSLLGCPQELALPDLTGGE
jgi:hypothetical protein